MKEHQNIEWKQTWRDEYLKWVCGFANAEGGTLEIGRDDAGNIVGVADAARLLEEIPNKVRDVLGIMVDVNLREDAGKEWLEIRVETVPQPGELQRRISLSQRQHEAGAEGRRAEPVFAAQTRFALGWCANSRSVIERLHTVCPAMVQRQGGEERPSR